MAAGATLNPYEILGVSKQATEADIKTAYRKLAKKHHPDLNPGNAAAERKFKDINQAYEWVGTPAERAKFDRGEIGPEAHQAPSGAGSGAGSGGFGGFSGGGAGGRAGARGPFYYQTQQDGGRYSQSFEGFDESIFESLFGRNGAGGGAGAGAGAGATGGARGGKASRPDAGEDLSFSLEIPFEDSILGATRQLGLPTGKTLEVKIPPGVETGAKLRFRGQGTHGGDAYVEIRVKESDRFRRHGRDVEIELPVTLAEAVLGGEIEVPTLDGTVRMKVPSGVSSGARLRVRGKGVRARGTTETAGDQIVVLKLTLPKEIDADLREAIAGWAAKHPESAGSAGTGKGAA